VKRPSSLNREHGLCCTHFSSFRYFFTSIDKSSIGNGQPLPPVMTVGSWPFHFRSIISIIFMAGAC
jgi:hypothetical protein